MYEQGNDFSVGYALGRDSDGNRNNGWGNDWSWIIALALIGGLFGNGFGFGGGFGGGFGYGAGFMPFELGKVATQADVASGFNNSAVLSSLNDLKLGQAGVQQTLCQGFNGINTTVMQGFHGVDNAICTLGYQQAQGFNTIGHQISDCCCATQRAIDGVKYANEKQTYDIIANQTAQTQRLLDFMVGEKLSAKDARIATLEAQISNDKQSAYLLDKLSPCPRPAYITCNPNAPYGLGYGVPYGYGTCGASVQ